MENISVCIISKNEEKNLGRCLEALSPYGFEIILTDTGSSDNTINIAKSYGAKISDFEWINDFSAARNFSILQASNDWVLIVDCDEFIEQFDKTCLIEHMKNNEKSAGRINQKSIIGEELSSVSSDLYIPRFFNRKYWRYQYEIHEQPVPINGNTSTYNDLPICVLHTGYLGDVFDKGLKAQRNLEILFAQLKKSPQNPYILCNIAMSYHMKKDYENAVKYFEDAFLQDVDPAQEYVRISIVRYGYCLLELKDLDQALTLCDLKENFADYADFFYMLGDICMTANMPIKALGYYLQSVTKNVCHTSGVNSYCAFYSIGRIYEGMKNIAMARLFYERAGDFKPAIDALDRLTAI